MVKHFLGQRKVIISGSGITAGSFLDHADRRLLLPLLREILRLLYFTKWLYNTNCLFSLKIHGCVLTEFLYLKYPYIYFCLRPNYVQIAMANWVTSRNYIVRALLQYPLPFSLTIIVYLKVLIFISTFLTKDNKLITSNAMFIDQT